MLAGKQGNWIGRPAGALAAWVVARAPFRQGVRVLTMSPLPRAAMTIICAIALLSSSCRYQDEWRGLIKLGLVAPFSGYDASSAGQALGAITAALSDTNRAGGIGGHRIELVALDDRNDPATAASLVRDLAADPAVLAAIARASGAASATSEYESHSLPSVLVGGPLLSIPNASAPSVCADAGAEGRAAAQFALEAHASHPAIVVSPGEGFAAAAAAFRRSYTGAVMELRAPDGPAAAGTTWLDAAAIDLIGSNADFVYLSTPYDIAARLASGLVGRSAVVSILLGNDADSPAAARLLPANASNVSFVSLCNTPASSATSDGQLVGTPTLTASGFVRGTAAAFPLVLTALRRAAASGELHRPGVGAAMSSGASAAANATIRGGRPAEAGGLPSGPRAEIYPVSIWMK